MNPHTEIDPRRCNGKPVVAGTRIPVTVVLDQLDESGSVEAVTKKHPELTRETVVAVFQYVEPPAGFPATSNLD
jgi:uncharacterized protein (DUF433 family)